MANDFSSWFTTLQGRSHGRSEPPAVALHLAKHFDPSMGNPSLHASPSAF